MVRTAYVVRLGDKFLRGHSIYEAKWAEFDGCRLYNRQNEATNSARQLKPRDRGAVVVPVEVSITA